MLEKITQGQTRTEADDVGDDDRGPDLHPAEISLGHPPGEEDDDDPQDDLPNGVHEEGGIDGRIPSAMGQFDEAGPEVVLPAESGQRTEIGVVEGEDPH